MTQKTDLNFVCDFLINHDNFAIICHSSPDGDTIGSGYALAITLKNMGKKVGVFCSDPIPKKFGFISDAFESNLEKTETVVSVDVADEALFGDGLARFKGNTVLAVDHHASNREFSDYLYCDPTAGATCEIIYEIIKLLGAEFTPDVLNALYTGIVTDTGCFKFSNAGEKTHLIAADLISRGVDSGEINRLMFDTKSIPRIKIEVAVMENMEFYMDGRVSFVAISEEMIKSSGCDENDLDGINSLSRTIEGVCVGITARQKANGKYKISLRTNDPVNAAEICEKFGGGGHIRAAGCEFCDSPEVFKPLILKEVEKALEEN